MISDKLVWNRACVVGRLLVLWIRFQGISCGRTAAGSPYKSFTSKISNGTATTIDTTRCSQLKASRLQFEHFIVQSGRTVPQYEQDQIILDKDHIHSAC